MRKLSDDSPQRRRERRVKNYLSELCDLRVSAVKPLSLLWLRQRRAVLFVVDAPVPNFFRQRFERFERLERALSPALAGDLLHQSMPAIERFFVLRQGAAFFRVPAFPAIVFLGAAEE